MTAKKKIVIALSCVLAVAAIVATSVTTTIALLHSSAVLTNTFAVGNVKLNMTESVVDSNGQKIGDGSRTDAGNTYKLIPGKTYDKDPTIFIQAKSEESYLFVQLRNDLKTIAAQNGNTIAHQMAENGWAKYKPGTNANTWIYVYCGAGNVPTVDATENTVGWDWTDKTGTHAAAYANCQAMTITGAESAETPVPIFSQFTVDENIDDEKLKGYNTAEIIVRAIAIQSATHTDVNDAWDTVSEVYSFIFTPNP